MKEDRIPIIEIAVGIAFSQGGMENVVNMTAGYLGSHGFAVRGLQFVDSGEEWYEGESFTLLSCSRDELVFETFVEKYVRYLKEKGCPDIILASGWPILVKVIKEALTRLGDEGRHTAVGSWLHGGFDVYKSYGQGEVDDLSGADFVLVMNTAIAGEIDRAFPEKAIHVIKNAVDTDRILYSENRGRKKLCYVGRFDPVKCFPLLLQALLVSPPEWTLKAVGAFEDNKHILESLVKEMGLESRVELFPWTDRPWDVLSDAAAMVCASRSEGFLLTAVEALACGMPVISTPVGIIPELIVPGKNGYIFPKDDPASLAYILRKIDEGVLPLPSAQACRESVAGYFPEEVFGEMAAILKEELSLKRLI